MGSECEGGCTVYRRELNRKNREMEGDKIEMEVAWKRRDEEGEVEESVGDG